MICGLQLWLVYILPQKSLKPGFAFNSRPAYLIIKWHHIISGNSHGSIQVTLTQWDKGRRMTVGSGSVSLSGIAMTQLNQKID